MRSALIGFALGVALLQMQASLPDTPWYVGGLVLAVLLGATAWKVPRPLLRVPLLATCGAWLGFLWAAAFAQYYLGQALPPAWEGHDITVIGTVADLPDRNAQGWRFRFDVEEVEPQNGVVAPVPSRISLGWYGNRRVQAPVEDGEGATPERQTLADLPPGSRWRLTVRLKRPHGNANPDGFDYELWLLQDNVRATGYVVGGVGMAQAAPNHMLDAFVWTPSHLIERVRGWLRERILAALPGAPYAPVVAALVMGDQRGISQEDWGVFNRTGISHLMAISGLHITMLAALWGGLASWLWRRSFFYSRARLPLRLPAQKVAVAAGLLAAFFYVLLAGAGVPAQRTLYMLAVVGVAFWTGRFTRISTVLCLALGLVLLIDPWALLWPGFWLSFGAVAILVYGTAGRMQPAYAMRAAVARRWWQRLWLALRTATRAQYVVTVGLVPLTMLLFGQASLISPIANALAIPLVGFVITPLALLGSIMPPGAIGWVLDIPQQLLEWLAFVLRWLDAMPWAVWEAPLPSWWMFLLALGGTVLMLAPRGWPARWLGLFAWVPLFVNGPTAPPDGSMRVTAFDVGQGMALLVETPGHRLLYDTGPRYSWQSDGATRVILPYLRARGITRLDRVVLSHSDSDHSGGALSLFKGIQVDSMLSSLPDGHPILRALPNQTRCEAGQSWNWDGIGFTMLHPTPSYYESDKWSPNARSCVLKVQIGRQSILLAGDIEALQEEHLVGGTMAEQLPSTVLLAPHHGSATSSTLPFLKAVHPELAIFQVGYRNRFNHPREDVYARYADQGIERLRTDESGAVTLSFGDRLQADPYRQRHPRYWYDQSSQ